MSTTRISVIPEAHIIIDNNNVVKMEDDAEDIYIESINPNDLCISQSLKKLQIDVDSIKNTLKMVVKMLHNMSVNKKQKVQTESAVRDKQLKRPIEPEVLEYVDVNEVEPVSKEQFFPIKSAKVFRLAEEKIYDEADFGEYVQMLLLELKDFENKEEALSKIISEEAMKEFNWDGRNDKQAVNVNFLFTTIFNAWKTETFKWADWKKCIDSVCSRSNKRRKENDKNQTKDTEGEVNTTQPIARARNSTKDEVQFRIKTELQKTQFNSLKRAIEDIKQMLSKEPKLDPETFPLKSINYMDKLSAEVKEDRTALNKLKSEFISTRSNCEKLRMKSFRHYFPDDVLQQYTWDGKVGKRSFVKETIFQILFECWHSESFNFGQYKSFVKNELNLLRCRKAARALRERVKESKEQETSN